MPLGLQHIAILTGLLLQDLLQLLWTPRAERLTQERGIATVRSGRFLYGPKLKIAGRRVIPIHQLSLLIQEISKHVVVVDDDCQSWTPEFLGQPRSQRLYAPNVLLVANRVENNGVILNLGSDYSPTTTKNFNNRDLARSFQSDVAIKRTHRCKVVDKVY